jgi:hypothetical protein
VCSIANARRLPFYALAPTLRRKSKEEEEEEMWMHEMRNGARKSPCNETRPCPYTKHESRRREEKEVGGFSLFFSLLDGQRKKRIETKKKRELSEGG